MAQLLSNLPIGTKVKFGKHSVNGETPQELKWLVANINNNVITLITSEVIDLRCFDAKESISEGGNARYDYSNLRQWLNSSSTNWYVAAHSGDAPPSGVTEVGGTKTYYSQRPGFLYHFSTNERNALLSTSVVTMYPPGMAGTYTVNDKVFLPSYTEVSNGTGEGTKFSLFNTTSYLKCNISTQAAQYSLASPSTGVTSWWLRTPDPGTSIYVRYISYDGVLGSEYPFRGGVGVRPCINLGVIKVSDTIDSDGCYTMVWNSAPYQPASINAPTIYGGKSNTISWSSVTDPDGDTVTYQLECSINGGAYTQIYSGSSTSYAHFVPFGTTSVAYRVKATDPSGESSAYTTSVTKTIINNHAPVISGSDDTLGVRSSGFKVLYTVDDADGDTVTVTEAIDGVPIRTLVATPGEKITCGIIDNTWLALSNGSHTLTIHVTDGIDTSVRTHPFTKLVNTIDIMNATPWTASSMPTRIMLVITRNIPPEATFKVEVCNNGYDSLINWEDCTDAVKSGLVHVFTNKSKTAANWGVLVRVTVDRNGAVGACYISAIGGNFE